MSKKNVRAIQDILKNCVPLQATLTHVEKIIILQEIIQDLLPPPLNQHCQVMSYRSGCLSLATDSSAWATRLRYESPNLIQKGRQNDLLRGLGNIKIQIQLREEYIPKQLREAVTLSAESAAIIKEQAKFMTDNAIREAFLCLASNADESEPV